MFHGFQLHEMCTDYAIENITQRQHASREQYP